MFDVVRMECQCGDVAQLLTILYLFGKVFASLHLVIDDSLLNITEVANPMLLVRIHSTVFAPFARFLLRLFQQIPIGHSIINETVSFHLVLSCILYCWGPFEKNYLLTPCA